MDDFKEIPGYEGLYQVDKNGKEVLCIDIDPDEVNDDTIKDALYDFGDR